MQRTSAVALAVYSLGVGYVVFRPSPVDQESRGGLRRLIEILHDYGLPNAIGYSEIEFLANVAMFVPLGLLLGLALGPRWWWLSVVVCVGLSTSIEVVQHLFLPERFATLRDVLANSTGAAFGTIAAGAVYSLTRRRGDSTD